MKFEVWERIRKLDRYDWLVFVATSTWMVLMSWYSSLEYFAFVDAQDYGNYIQAIWSTTKGYLLADASNYFYVQGYPNTIHLDSFLSSHFSPILFLIVPFYLIYQSPITLVIFQDVLVGLGVIPVYLLGKKLTTSREGFVFAIAYLTNSSLIFATINNFHAEVFIIPLLTFAIYFGYNRDWKRFGLFALLGCMVDEYTPILVGGVVLYLIWSRRLSIRYGVPSLLLVGGYWLFAFYIRMYLGYNPATDNQIALTNFSTLGIINPSFLSIPLFAILHPTNAWNALILHYNIKLLFMMFIFSNTIFLSLYHYKSIVMLLPWLSFSMLSSDASYYSPFLMYPSFLLFGVLIVAVLGYKDIRKRHTPKLFMYLILMFILVFSIVSIITVLAYTPQLNISQSDIQSQLLIDRLPANASIITVGSIFPHVANRIDAWQLNIAPYVNNSFTNIQSHYLALNQSKVLIDHISPTYAIIDYNTTYNTWDNYSSYWLLENLIIPRHYILVANSSLIQVYQSPRE